MIVAPKGAIVMCAILASWAGYARPYIREYPPLHSGVYVMDIDRNALLDLADKMDLELQWSPDTFVLTNAQAELVLSALKEVIYHGK
jgi:hypothetical protein